jgi:hypothetical protein
VTLAVVAAVAVPTAAVLTLAVNARRVATFPERFTEAVGGDGDAVVVQPAGPPLTDDVRALPTVRDAESLTFVFAEPTEPTPSGARPEVNVFGITDLRAAGAIVVSGRAPSSETPGEFVANRSFVRAYGLELGDRVPFATASQQQVDAAVVLSEELTGPTVDGMLVGLIDGPADLDDPTPTVFFASTLLEQPVGIVATLIGVHLTPGTSLEEFRASLDGLPGHEQLFLQPGRVVSDSARDTFRAQAVGSTILAVVAGLATVAAVGQLLLRQRAAGVGERRALLPLGYTGRQSAVEGIGWAATVVGAGVLLGALGSILLTPLVPRGFARRLDPEAGEVLLDPVIAIGAVVLALALLGWVAAGVLLSRPATAERPSSAADTLARSLRPEAATGVRFAFARGRNGRSALVTTATLAIAIAAMLGSAVFASNIDALTADPARYGSDFDYITGNSFGAGEPQPWPAVETLDGLAAASFVATGSAVLDEQDVDVVGYEPVRGSLLAPVLAGSFPVSADELAIGRTTARELGVREGDEVTLTGGSGTTAAYRVVGQAVLPNPSFGLGGGHGVAMLLSGWRRLEPDAEPNSLMIDLEPGTSVPDELQPFSPQTPQEQTRPTDVVNLDRARSVPNLLAIVIGLLAMLTLGHALLLSVRQRRCELAVLRSLGADRRWVGRTVHAQASALTVAALAVGLPAGLVGGRLLFRAFVDRLGLVSDPITPVLLVLLLAVGVLAVANVAAAVPARRARDTPVATLLHPE